MNISSLFVHSMCKYSAVTFLATLRIAFSYMHIAHPTLSIAKASVTHCTFAGVAKASYALSGCMLFLVLCVKHRYVFVSVCAICFTIDYSLLFTIVLSVSLLTIHYYSLLCYLFHYCSSVSDGWKTCSFV